MRPSTCGFGVGAMVLLLWTGAASGQRDAARAADAGVTFTEIAREAGLDAVHVNGASHHKHIVESIGSGGLFVDYDADGWIDILLVDGGSPTDPAVACRARHRLYRNRGDGTFADVTATSGIMHRGYGMGACAADYDNDGWTDLYITSYGPNTLYRNNGDGTFTNVSRAAGVDTALWSTGCAFADLDRDGHLDLFVTNYVVAGAAELPYCGQTRPQPDAHYGLASALRHAGRGDEAAAHLDRFRRLQHAAVEDLRRTLGQASDERRSAIEEDVIRWQRLVDSEPEHAGHHRALGEALVGAGRADLGAQHLERAAALGGPAAIYLQLAELYGALGRSEDRAMAQAEYERRRSGDAVPARVD